jgi:hypothetical protein
VNRAVWALGLRNPFTFAVQPGTGRIFINDVGQNTFEEINDGIAGSNYGWPNSEGVREPGDPATTIGIYRDPLFTYDHHIGPTGGCAITGGAFYNPITAQFPADYNGDYFFADLCSSWIRRFDPATNAVTGFASNLPDAPVDLKVDAAGNLYYLTRGSGSSTGQVTRVRFTQTAPVITQQPVNQRVTAGQSATFSAGATGATPLSFQWQRDDIDIPGATATTLTLPTTSLSDNGASFRVVVTNSNGTATSDDAVLSVVDNEPPVADITLPSFGTRYNAGDTIDFVGTGTDHEDGNLPANAFTWEVVFHHADHVHPFLQPFGNVTSGSFTIPTLGETATDVFYRIQLTVTDSFGFTDTTFRDIVPNTSVITLQTNPVGLNLTLDGIVTATPASIESVVGMNRTLGISSTNATGGVFYEFVSWSDDGAPQHDLSTPASDTTVTASFQVITEPHVTELRVERISTRSRRLVIAFDRPLEPASAASTLNYQIMGRGRDGRFGTPSRPSSDDALIPFDNPVYQTGIDPTTSRMTSMVILNVPSGISNDEFFQLTIDGSRAGAGDPALVGINGDVLDGELAGGFPSGDGSTGGDFVALFGMGKSLSYVDASGDSVSLDLKRQGTLTIIREAPAADGVRSEALALYLSDTGSRSKLKGRVSGKGQTSFDRAIGLTGVANNVQNNPSFVIAVISSLVSDRARR